jgi:hypothetical protein
LCARITEIAMRKDSVISRSMWLLAVGGWRFVMTSGVRRQGRWALGVWGFAPEWSVVVQAKDPGSLTPEARTTAQAKLPKSLTPNA